MENLYDLNTLKTKIFIQNNDVFIENDEKIFVFKIFYDKFTNKTSLLFKEIFGDKMTLNNAIFVKYVINNLKKGYRWEYLVE